MGRRDFSQKAHRAWKVAASLRRLLKGKDRLRHRDAVHYIRGKFGEEFIYPNRNGNAAISPNVLHIFEMFTESELVWAKHGRYWRRRRPDDPTGTRMVRF